MNATTGFEVVATAQDGARAVELTDRLRPDVVVMDVDMPVLDGLGALQQIMLRRPTPIVMVTGVSRSAADVALQAVQAGAVDFILKYSPWVNTDPEALRRDVIAKVRAASGVRVIGAMGRRSFEPDAPSPRVPAPRTQASPPVDDASAPRLEPVQPEIIARNFIVIGASTGGPVALRELIRRIPVGVPAAVLIVQHLAPGFTRVLAEQLNAASALPVAEAEDGETPYCGRVYIAPATAHLELDGARLRLTQSEKVNGFRPSIDVLMESLAARAKGELHAAVLTGMGVDGGKGLARIAAAGGRTYAQDRATSIVYGMPAYANQLGGVQFIGSPLEIADRIVGRLLRSVEQTAVASERESSALTQ